MGNCCISPAAITRDDVKSKNADTRRDKDRNSSTTCTGKKSSPPITITILLDIPKESINNKYLVDRELGRGEFGVTYLCIDRRNKELLACKSISKRKLRTTIDCEDMRREVTCNFHCLTIINNNNYFSSNNNSNRMPKYHSE